MNVRSGLEWWPAQAVFLPLFFELYRIHAWDGDKEMGLRWVWYLEEEDNCFKKLKATKFESGE